MNTTGWSNEVLTTVNIINMNMLLLDVNMLLSVIIIIIIYINQTLSDLHTRLFRTSSEINSNTLNSLDWSVMESLCSLSLNFYTSVNMKHCVVINVSLQFHLLFLTWSLTDKNQHIRAKKLETHRTTEPQVSTQNHNKYKGGGSPWWRVLSSLFL